jgi:glycerol kinase
MKDGMQLVDLLDEGCTDAYSLIQNYEATIIGRGRDAVESTSFAAMNWVEGTARSAWQNELA